MLLCGREIGTAAAVHGSLLEKPVGPGRAPGGSHHAIAGRLQRAARSAGAGIPANLNSLWQRTEAYFHSTAALEHSGVGGETYSHQLRIIVFYGPAQ